MAWCEKRTQSGRVTWRVVWRQDGERQQQTFTDKAEADEFLAGVQANGNRWPRGWIKGRGWAENVHESDAPTFREYAERTIGARSKADERTKSDYRAMLRRHVYPVIGDIPIDRVTRFHVVEVAERMAKAGRRPKTVANVHAVMSSVFDDACQKEDPPLARRNPARGELPKHPDGIDDEVVFLSRGEFAMIRSHIPTQVDADLALLLVGTGLRWSEATALQVHDVDLLGRRSLTVQRAWKRRGGLFELGQPKTRRSRRTIALSPVLVSMLAEYVAGKAPHEFVFTTANGHAIRHSNWYNRVWLPAVLRARQCDTHAAAPERAGKPCERCPGVLTKQPTIHSLRHTHASWLIDDKITLPAIQRRLGHESIQTTIDRYGHLAPEHVDEINDAVDRALGPVPDHESV